MRTAADSAYESGAIAENVRFAAHTRQGQEAAMAQLGAAIAKLRGGSEGRTRSVMGPNDGPQLPMSYARPAETVNEAMVAAGQRPAWLPETNVVTEVVPKGTRYEMVVNEGQALALVDGKPAFGMRATPDAVPNQAFARDKLAFLPQFKPDVSFVVTVEATAPQAVNRGYVGPQDNYSGTAAQVEFLGPKNLRIVGQTRPLPKQ